MAQTIKLKRSAVAAKVPLTTDIALGELAINTYDGKMYFKKDSGTASIVRLATIGEVVELAGNQSISGTKKFSDSVGLNVVRCNTDALNTTAFTISAPALPNNSVSGPTVTFGSYVDVSFSSLVSTQTLAVYSSLQTLGNDSAGHIDLGMAINQNFNGKVITFYSGSNSTSGGAIHFGKQWTTGLGQTSSQGVITNLKDPTNTYDAANKKYVDDQDATKAPVSADYLVKTANATLSAERVVGDSTSVTANWTTAGAVSFERAALTGDVTASANSNSTTIANSVVTYAKIQNVSATDKLLGRSSAGSGVVEEIACTSAGRALLDDADAAAQRTTLGAAADTDVVKLTGTQSIAGAKTFSDTVVATNGYQIGSSALNTQTGNYTLLSTDNGKIIIMNSSSAQTLTVNTNAGAAGFTCTVVQIGTGQVTIAASGTTLNSYSGLKLAGQHAAATLVCYTTNTLNVSGNLST